MQAPASSLSIVRTVTSGYFWRVGFRISQLLRYNSRFIVHRLQLMFRPRHLIRHTVTGTQNCNCFCGSNINFIKKKNIRLKKISLRLKLQLPVSLRLISCASQILPLHKFHFFSCNASMSWKCIISPHPQNTKHTHRPIYTYKGKDIPVTGRGGP
jgi:hypothetical protein